MTQKKSQYRRGGFTFKQFFVGHSRCAMKVGTDGVLLGAWAPVEHATRILDIGTGSGLIALMLAQRTSKDILVDAVELDSDAATQAQDNVFHAPWATRVSVYQQDIHDFSQSNAKKYTLIVSNPPYFEPALACRDDARNKARYTESLNHDNLLRLAQYCLADDGLFCVILPHEVGQLFEQRAHKNGWFTSNRIDVSDTPSSNHHRMLLALSRDSDTTQKHSSLAIKNEDGTYSADFRMLISDFYVNY